MNCGIEIPAGATEIISRLCRDGHKAYVVGGCVRDSIRGATPHDWDICTSATPEQVKASVGTDTIDTGLRHGTITVRMPDGNYEVTTFRVDGNYSDGRRPDSVSFTENIVEDLSRRDFTMNAIAYNDTEGVVDPFGGVYDIHAGIIRCVGNPDERFKEDALRVMRALRFASTFGWRIDSETAHYAKLNAQNVTSNVSVERIYSELTKIICGDYAGDVMLEYPDIFCAIIPEFLPCYGFNQNNKYHKYTVYDHIANALNHAAGSDVFVKYALFFHDIGKPMCYTEDENGGHFRGHNVTSYDTSRMVMSRLRFDSKTLDEVSTLVLHHDATIEPEPKVVRRWLNKIGEESFRRLIEIRIADIRAQDPATSEERVAKARKLNSIADQVIAEDQCFSLRDMNLNGNDIIAIGVKEGRRIGHILNDLLSKVIDGEINNDHDELLDAAKRMAVTEQ